MGVELDSENIAIKQRSDNSNRDICCSGVVHSFRIGIFSFFASVFIAYVIWINPCPAGNHKMIYKYYRTI